MKKRRTKPRKPQFLWASYWPECPDGCRWGGLPVVAFTKSEARSLVKKHLRITSDGRLPVGVQFVNVRVVGVRHD